MLRDGASSQYGSDAIAGVINVQLKKASQGGRAVASYGKYVHHARRRADLDGLQTDAGGQPILDPADNRYFLANIDGERKARDGALTTFGANIGLPIGARLCQPDRRISRPQPRPTAPASTCGPITSGRRRPRSTRAS